MFISNIDNLGALVDLEVLYHVADKDIDFCACAVDHTRADTDGGVLVSYRGEALAVAPA
jgi:UTP--glucose-1-phosphate uridylyltransferase